MAIIPLYATSIHEVAASNNLKQMKAIAHQAEEFLVEHGNVAAALEVLKHEIAKIESGNYG